MAFVLPPLPYAHDALEQVIDAQTMHLHHEKHHGGYVANLNAALEKHPELFDKSAEALISDLNAIPEDIRTAVRNNGGGHVNHSMFWQIMSPNGGGEPKGALGEAIQKAFGGFDDFRNQMNDAGLKRFGSGWAWLVQDKGGALKIMSTANQDNPLMEGLTPIMGTDVWEHAYYLRYQNRRGDYLKLWWDLVNWDEVNRRFEGGR